MDQDQRGRSRPASVDTPVVRSDQLGQKKALTLAIAEQGGIKNKWRGMIAIVGDAGNLINRERMDLQFPTIV